MQRVKEMISLVVIAMFCIFRSEKISVRASAISRVIGHGDGKINTIRKVSGTKIAVEKNKKSGERVITIT